MHGGLNKRVIGKLPLKCESCVLLLAELCAGVGDERDNLLPQLVSLILDILFQNTSWLAEFLASQVLKSKPALCVNIESHGMHCCLAQTTVSPVC